MVETSFGGNKHVKNSTSILQTSSLKGLTLTNSKHLGGNSLKTTKPIELTMMDRNLRKGMSINILDT